MRFHTIFVSFGSGLLLWATPYMFISKYSLLI